MTMLETVNKLLKKKADDMEVYSRRPCMFEDGLQRDEHENNNLTNMVVGNISSKIRRKY